MKYYFSQQYQERYFIQFADVDENVWRVSIQDPLYFGDATELTGGEFPVEWEGRGDEDQTEVVLGSTGSIRLVCMPGQEDIFKSGALLPKEINDRRVQIMRYTKAGSDHIWGIYWQGFILPETFTQAWDRTPYEIEIPIVSAIAATEYFPMPTLTDDVQNNILYEKFMEQTNIAGLLRLMIYALGCDYRNIVTNKPIYEDFNGKTQVIPVPGLEGTMSYEAHWTQGTVSAQNYYDFDNGTFKPRTFKDVLENICYPYGKVQEYSTDILFLMRWRNDANSGSMFYLMSVYDVGGDFDTSVRFVEYMPIHKLNLSDLTFAGADHSLSLLPAPESVNFTNNVEKNTEIFELTDKYIKTGLNFGKSWHPDGTQGHQVNLNRKARFVAAIKKDYINTDFATYFYSANEIPGGLEFNGQREYPFCRVVEVDGEPEEGYTYSNPVPLGFCFNVLQSTGYPQGSHIRFTLRNGVRSVAGINRIKMTITPYIENVQEPAFSYGEGDPFQLVFTVTDTSNQKHLKIEDGKHTWESSGHTIYFDDIEKDGEQWILYFNEHREASDNTSHRLKFEFAFFARGFPNCDYGKAYLKMKLEYVATDGYYEDAVAAKFAEGLGKNGDIRQYGGSGESISINFETMAGKKHLLTDGGLLMPYNSFCNAQTYIDTQEREKLEIDGVTFERITFYPYQADFLANYIVVKDGEKVYLPVAVGMNPRMNQMKLTLVSTNVKQ